MSDRDPELEQEVDVEHDSEHVDELEQPEEEHVDELEQPEEEHVDELEQPEEEHVDELEEGEDEKEEAEAEAEAEVKQEDEDEKEEAEVKQEDEDEKEEAEVKQEDEDEKEEAEAEVKQEEAEAEAEVEVEAEAEAEVEQKEVEMVAPTEEEALSFAIEEVMPSTPPQPLSAAPKLVFIVPYRDREQQQIFFANHMTSILEDYPVGDYQIFYIHQSDKRSFNRGAMKNIGFLHVKALYPNDYKNITLVFNDVDTMPLTKGFFNYETTVGVVKHFYGYKFTLGGIVSINAGDFEKIDGFPNYWAWGYEDNSLQNRIIAANITIDRSQFYPILDKNVMQLKDGVERMVNRQEYDRYIEEAKYKVVNDGISKIANLAYIVDKTKGFVHVSQFTTAVAEKSELNQLYDLRNGPVPFKLNTSQRRGRPVMRMGGGF